MNEMYDEKGMLKPKWELTESEKRNMLKPDFCMNNPHINDMAMENDFIIKETYVNIMSKTYYRPYYSEGKILYKGIDGKDYPDMSSLEQANKLYWKRQLESLQSSIKKYYDALLRRVEEDLPLSQKRLAPELTRKYMHKVIKEYVSGLATNQSDKITEDTLQTLIKK